MTWAVDLLDVQPDDHVLELGCGPGVAMGLVADLLGRGQITALDRSATAIERARARNAHHLAAGRAVLHHGDLAGFRAPPTRFDKAFAINVNVFWTTGAEAECAMLRHVLRPGGVLRLVYDAPSPGGASATAFTVAAKLGRHGFTTEVTHSPSVTLVCVTGVCQPQG